MATDNYLCLEAAQFHYQLWPAWPNLHRPAWNNPRFMLAAAVVGGEVWLLLLLLCLVLVLWLCLQMLKEQQMSCSISFCNKNNSNNYSKRPDQEVGEERGTMETTARLLTLTTNNKKHTTFISISISIFRLCST